MNINNAIEQLLKMRQAYGGKREVYSYMGPIEEKEMLFTINEFRVIPDGYTVSEVNNAYVIGDPNNKTGESAEKFKRDKCYHCRKEIVDNFVNDEEFHHGGMYCSSECLENEKNSVKMNLED